MLQNNCVSKYLHSCLKRNQQKRLTTKKYLKYMSVLCTTVERNEQF